MPNSFNGKGLRLSILEMAMNTTRFSGNDNPCPARVRALLMVTTCLSVQAKGSVLTIFAILLRQLPT